MPITFFACKYSENGQKDYPFYLFFKVLQHFNMEGGTIMVTLPPYVKLGAEDNPTSNDEKVEMAKTPYTSAVGSLMYAIVATCLPISFAVGVVSSYMANPGKKH